jgi:hypothetical protein
VVETLVWASVGLAAVLAGSPGGAAQSASPRVITTGNGLVLTLVQETHTPREHNFVFLVQQAGLPESQKPFTIANGMTAIETARIHSPDTVAIVGAMPTPAHALSIIDAHAGTIVFQAICTDLRLTPDESRYLCTDSDGKMRSYRLATREVRPALSPVAGTLRVLSSGSVQARRKLLQAFRTSTQLSRSPEVRTALLGELDHQLAHDIELAAASPTQDGIRIGSAERDYLGDLVATVAQMHESAALPLLCRIDHLSAVGALAMQGPSAVPYILQALRSPVPRGYSMYYRAGLLESLVLILRFPDAKTIDRTDIAKVTRTSIEHPTSVRELVQALALAEELDDDSLDGNIRALAQDVGVIQRRGITNPVQVQEVQTKAQSVLSHRVAIR